MKDMKDHQFILQSVMIPVAIIILILAARFCRMEKKKSLMVVMVILTSQFFSQSGSFYSAMLTRATPDFHACHCGEFRYGCFEDILLDEQ